MAQRMQRHGRAGVSPTRASVTAQRRQMFASSCFNEMYAPDGSVRPDHGWTSLVVTPERGVRAVDGLLTGWHEPDASHLLLLEAIAGRPLLDASYAAATAAGYRRHEFGDLHLLLP